MVCNYFIMFFIGCSFSKRLSLGLLSSMKMSLRVGYLGGFVGLC